ncbi:hypothetical protein F2P81_011895 [Scophthalmus maximus]|uniref:Uncharacterized protein n=1 Tax=Scophthalmus maximus TaxID=52904 RepID=A0A6A4SRG6_SCOMX|nr:hypothetical protein F2P81_011895 [Scophthalmus maximus]
MEDCLMADLYAVKRPAPAYIPELLLDVDDSGSDGELELLVSDDDAYEDSLTQSDMQDICKRGAAKLDIPWSTVKTDISRSRYDGKKLPKIKKRGRHLLSIFAERLDELALAWKSQAIQRLNTHIGVWAATLINNVLKILYGVIINNVILGLMIEAHEVVGEFVSKTLDDQELVRNIRDSKFDLLLTDPGWGGGAILAKYLNLPLVYNVRWLVIADAHLAIAPSPISYIPITGSGNTDKMNFFQRVKNIGVYLLTQTQYHLVVKQTYQRICDKYLGPDNEFHQLVLNADIWLMRTDFVFEYPRPTMPNVVYMGGFQCKPAKPLPEHLKKFVQSSGEHGVIIMSLGTFVSELPADMTNEIAAAFAKLPQKVIWRHKGDRPATLGNNTLLVDWMPQNDLLGHPKIKLFVAHGGTNGVQEAIYHGIPVVGLPLFFDQYDNLLRLKERGGAKILTLATVDKDNFLETVQEVLNEPSYRANMQRLSRLHRDQPITPLDKALFWIEFVMRHKGAAHLRTESYRLPWYSYHSVDVVLFLAGAVLLVLLFILMLMRCLYAALCKSKVKQE